MNRGIFAAAAGMRSNQAQLDVLSNNLANLNTVGYKRDGVAFADMLVRRMTVPDGPFEREVGTLGAGATIGAKFTYAEQGTTVVTGAPLDVSLDEPNRFLVVQTPQGVRYTRDGSLTVDADGNLVNRDGFEVLDVAGRPIFVGRAEEVSEAHIATNATVIVNGVEVGVLDVREGNLQKVGKNLWAGDAASVADPVLTPGSLEASNVNAIEAMVQMIALMRNFESAQRAVQAQDEMTGRLLQSLANR